MKHLALIVILAAALAGGSGAERDTAKEAPIDWPARAATVKVGMTRAEVWKILPPWKPQPDPAMAYADITLSLDTASVEDQLRRCNIWVADNSSMARTMAEHESFMIGIGKTRAEAKELLSKSRPLPALGKHQPDTAWQLNLAALREQPRCCNIWGTCGEEIGKVIGVYESFIVSAEWMVAVIYDLSGGSPANWMGVRNRVVSPAKLMNLRRDYLPKQAKDLPAGVTEDSVYYWQKMTSRVRAVMTRAEVERLLPPPQWICSERPRTGPADQYWVSARCRVTVSYDGFGGEPNKGWISESNRVISPAKCQDLEGPLLTTDGYACILRPPSTFEARVYGGDYWSPEGIVDVRRPIPGLSAP